jgi:hypothetical protein
MPEQSWLHVSTRRLFLFLSYRSRASAAVFEPNNQSLCGS